MMRVFEDNQKRRGACYGCELLEQVPFEEWNVDQVKITNIVWNHFRGCNSRCVYCGDRNKFKKYYEAIKVCIWGMGACGNELLDILEKRKIQVEWVGDNAVNKHGKSFHNIQCFSLDQLVVQAKKETSVCILLAISHYGQIYSDLMRNLPNAEIRVINVL